MKKLLIAFFLFLLLPPATNAMEKAVLSTLNWEPYIGESMKDQGYVAVLVKEAFRRGGVAAEFKFYQWTRTVGLAKNGRVDGYFPEYYADSVTGFATFSDPFPGGPLGFFQLKRSNISYSTLEDLKGLRIGTVKSYINTREFDEADFLLKDPVRDDLTNFKKLVAGRIDLVVADKFVGLKTIRDNMPQHLDKIEFLPTPLENKKLYVCISKKTDNGEALLKAFNTGLQEMKSDGSIDRILRDFGF